MVSKKYLWIIPAMLVAGGAAAIIWSAQSPCNASSDKCPDSSPSAQPTAPTQSKLNIDQINRDLQAGALLVDVREPSEFSESHAEGAVNLPLGQIQGGTYPTADKAAKIFLYCRSGVRAGNAMAVLKSAGYQNVVSLGGLTDWQSQGGKVVGQTNANGL